MQVFTAEATKKSFDHEFDNVDEHLSSYGDWVRDQLKARLPEVEFVEWGYAEIEKEEHFWFWVFRTNAHSAFHLQNLAKEPPFMDEPFYAVKTSPGMVMFTVPVEL